MAKKELPARTLKYALKSIKEGRVEELYNEINSEDYQKFTALKVEADAKDSFSEQIEFWHRQLKEYTNLRITPYVSTVSGSVVSLTLDPRPLFLDKFITNEITYLTSIQKLTDEIISTDTQPEIKEVQQKVAWLYAIGVLDDLGKSTGVTSSNGQAKILRPVIGGNREAIRKAIERIRKNEDGRFDNYSEWINSECQRLKISRRH